MNADTTTTGEKTQRVNVICFGDSNTYGYDPRGYFGGRYDADCRWVDILATGNGAIPNSV